MIVEVAASPNGCCWLPIRCPDAVACTCTCALHVHTEHTHGLRPVHTLLSNHCVKNMPSITAAAALACALLAKPHRHHAAGYCCCNFATADCTMCCVACCCLAFDCWLFLCRCARCCKVCFLQVCPFRCAPMLPLQMLTGAGGAGSGGKREGSGTSLSPTSFTLADVTGAATACTAAAPAHVTSTSSSGENKVCSIGTNLHLTRDRVPTHRVGGVQGPTQGVVTAMLLGTAPDK
jgi:hypothetical protein